MVVLGGAGMMGRIIVRDLARTRGLEIVIADRELGSARGLPGTRVRVDVSRPRELKRVLDGAFAVIASLPYRFNVQIMRATLEARAHYLDLGGLFHETRRQMKLDRAFREAGRTALLGMGSAPGIVNVLAVHAAAGMESVREIHCMVGSVDLGRVRGVTSPLGFGYSPDTLLDEFQMDSAVFRGGRLRMVPALDPAERIVARFPRPVGPIALHTTLHSEVATLPLGFAERGVREVTFRQGFDPTFVERLSFLVRLGLVDDRPLDGLAVSPRRVLLTLLDRDPAAKAASQPRRYEIVRAMVRGRRRGTMVTVNADCHAGPDAGHGVGPDIDTGAPPSIAVQMLHSGEIEARPGVWSPERLVPPGPLIRELERRGMRVERRTAR